MSMPCRSNSSLFGCSEMSSTLSAPSCRVFCPPWYVLPQQPAIDEAHVLTTVYPADYSRYLLHLGRYCAAPAVLLLPRIYLERPCAHSQARQPTERADIPPRPAARTQRVGLDWILARCAAHLGSVQGTADSPDRVSIYSMELIDCAHGLRRRRAGLVSGRACQGPARAQTGAQQRHARV